MTSLCTCHRCDYALRRIASDAGDVAARSRQTEPERRRATGEYPFDDGPAEVKIARTMLRDVVRGEWAIDHAHVSLFACQMVAAQLRAIVLQELVDRIVAWCEAEVSP